MNEIQVHLRLEGKIAILQLKGDVTAQAEKRILAAYDRASSQKVKCVLLDFSAVGYINSAGMAIIINMLTRSQAQGERLCAFGLSPHFLKIFEMVGLLKYVRHFASEAEAREHCT